MEWFTNIKDTVGDWVEDGVDFVEDGFEDLTDKVTDITGIDDLQETIAKLKSTGQECSTLAYETRDLCDRIETKGQDMVKFGSEVHETLAGYETGDNDASILETIQDLTDGDKVREAMNIAKDTDTIALECIDKSIQMMDIMERTLVDVPDFLENQLRKFAEKYDVDGEETQDQIRQLMDVDQPLQDLQDCIAALQEFNITTAYAVGKSAFEQLSQKMQLSMKIFASVQGFAVTVGEALEGFQDFDFQDLRDLRNNSKILLVCVRRTGIMRSLAESAKKLIEIVVDLFHETAERVSTLWEALAYCKECMNDCVQDINDTKTLCCDARDKSLDLVERSSNIKDKLELVGDLNKDSFQAIKDLTIDNGEIKEAIALAQTMDDLVIECTGKVIHMITRVTDAFQKLPEIITDGLDVETSGQKDDDPIPRDIQEDIAQLETAREEMEQANLLQVAKSGKRCFEDVGGKVDICKDMLVQVNDFSFHSLEVIDDFMGIWNLELAMDKIRDMCRLVSLAQLIQNFAHQVKHLVEAAIQVLATSLKKLTINYDEFTDNLVDKVEDTLDDFIGEDMADKVGDVVENMADALKFWD